MRVIGASFWIVMLLGMSALRPAAAGPMHLAQPDVAAFPRIQLYLYPSGDAGRPITGASARDFEVREGGRVVSIEEFRDSSHGAPVEVCLTIDRSGSMHEQSKLPGAQQAALLFLRSLRPDDRAALVSFADQATLDRSLTHDLEGLSQATAGLRAYGGTALYDALYWSVNQVALAPVTQGSMLTRPARSEARRVVLALTDGNDNRSRATAQQVITLARANGVTVYTIGLGSDAQAEELDRLARATGGRYFPAPRPEALAQLYALIARQLHSEYALSYRTPNPARDGSRREVRVRLQTPGGALTAVGWYQAPGAGSSVVTLVPAAPAPAGPSLSGGPASPASGAFQLIGLLAVVLAATGLAVYLLWTRRGDPLLQSGRAGEVAAIAASASAASTERTLLNASPRLDLRPLWVRAPVTVVGRAEENDLVLDSPLVSRRHARIEVADGAYRVIDDGSSNGTYLNGHRVTEAPISVGDVLRFADQEFRFAGEQTI